MKFLTKYIFCRSRRDESICGINPQAPVAQKTVDEVLFRHFQGEGVDFFLNRTSPTPHQIFDAHLLINTDLDPSRFYFSVGFISRSCFESNGFIAYSNE